MQMTQPIYSEELEQPLNIEEVISSSIVSPGEPVDEVQSKDDTYRKQAKKLEKLLKQLKEQHKKPELSNTRPLDSMFRNAYRTQMDLVRLADIKANIMISINGFILSILVAGTGLNQQSEPWFFWSVGAFLITCLSSMFFAVLAARPRLRNPHRSPDEFYNEQANILFFYDQDSISADEYVEVINQLQGEPQKIYHHMSRHVHSLGKVVARKFRFLYIAYSLFIYGFGISFILFLLVFFK